MMCVMSMTHTCHVCKVTFTRKQHFDTHLKSKKHLKYLCPQEKRYQCLKCGNTFAFSSGLSKHKKICTAVRDEVSDNVLDEEKEQLKREIVALRESHEEMKKQISDLFEKFVPHIGTQNVETQNNDHSNNIHIHINAFGNENTDYLDDNVILDCIGRVYKSVPTVVQKIHFDPEHPENHNIRINNRQLPYVSVMNGDSEWKFVNKTDIIETMVHNGYNLLEEKYPERKDRLTPKKRKNFEGFQQKFESKDKDLMRQLKSDVELLVLNGNTV